MRSGAKSHAKSMPAVFFFRPRFLSGLDGQKWRKGYARGDVGDLILGGFGLRNRFRTPSFSGAVFGRRFGWFRDGFWTSFGSPFGYFWRPFGIEKATKKNIELKTKVGQQRPATPHNLAKMKRKAEELKRMFQVCFRLCVS